jgi:hypothetical protein
MLPLAMWKLPCMMQLPLSAEVMDTQCILTTPRARTLSTTERAREGSIEKSKAVLVED